LSETGIYKGDFAHDWIRSELANLGVRTFGDLAIDAPHLPPEQRYRLVVTVSDVTTGQLVRLPWDYHRLYGLDPDEQQVADAVRASMSIPFFFRAAKLTSTAGLTSTLVDGGMLSNFPIDSFDRRDGKPPRWPTFGVTLLPNLPQGNDKVIPALAPVNWLFGGPPLIEALITTMIVGRDQAYLNQPWVDSRAIRVDSSKVGFLDFNIGTKQMQELYQNGHDAAEAFLKSWDWNEYLERFRREARAVARLSHPNIVTVIDRGDDGGRQYIVFEHVEGENLKELVTRTGRLPPRRALELVIPVADGLAFAHERGLVHRDVKPQNVLLSSEGEIKVTDFGIARSLDVEHGVTQTGTVLGTSEYLAPEQASGEPVSPATDEYSLGVVLWELLTGEVPFTGENFVAVALRHVNEPPPSLREQRPDLSPRLAAANGPPRSPASASCCYLNGGAVRTPREASTVTSCCYPRQETCAVAGSRRPGPVSRTWACGPWTA